MALGGEMDEKGEGGEQSTTTKGRHHDQGWRRSSGYHDQGWTLGDGWQEGRAHTPCKGVMIPLGIGFPRLLGWGQETARPRTFRPLAND